mmetsp:Transcript_60375/g.165836  ORF Transcript_60375/g.165836 Transcript_60375/m.165836 type:complete len:168 (-) Transcript_60375:517-1020(-)
MRRRAAAPAVLSRRRCGGGPLLLLLLCLLLLAATAYKDDESVYMQQAGHAPPTYMPLSPPELELIGRPYGTDPRALPHPPTSLHAWFGAPPGSRVLVVAVHAYGFANRMRALASALQVAQDSNRTLLLDWSMDEGCGAGFDDLFNASAPPMAAYLSRYRGDGALLQV